MAIVINGSGTISGISVGGLPDSIVDAGTLATNSVDSAELIDGAVDNSHLADDAVNSDEIAAGAIDAAHLASLVGVNTPSFSVRMASILSVATSTNTKLPWAYEDWDSDSAFDSATNYRFTVPTGKGGKYQFTCVSMQQNLDDGEYAYLKVYKNGSEDTKHGQRLYQSTSDVGHPRIVTTMSLAAGDYIEIYYWHNQGANQNVLSDYSLFSGFRLTGV
jgi:hypothetical protein